MIAPCLVISWVHRTAQNLSSKKWRTATVYPDPTFLTKTVIQPVQ